MYHKYLPTQPTPSPPYILYGFLLLSIYTDQGLPLPGLNANDSYLDLEERIEAMHLFRVTLFLFISVLSYPFPIDSLILSLSDSSVLGLLVVPETIPNELNSIEGLNP